MSKEVLRLYWSVGHDILERQERDGWGANVVDRFSRDMREEFPDQQGWSLSGALAIDHTFFSKYA